MAPTSYQAPHKSDTDDKSTTTQSLQTGMRAKGDGATVQTILDEKGTNVFYSQPGEKISQATEIMRDRNIGALVVVDDSGRLIGILSERDIVRQLADTPGETLAQSVGDLMTANPITCQPNERLIEMLQRMTDGRFRHLPVVKSGRLVGLITIGDVVKHRLRELEYEALRLKQLIVG